MRAGFSRKEITPSYPVYMAGFDRRKAPSTGSLMPLYVSVLALDNAQGNTVLLFSYDVLGTDAALCDLVRSTMQERFGIPAVNVWVSATHTHSAPSCIFKGGHTYDEAYVAFLLQQSVLAAEEALNARKEARASFEYTTVSGLGSKRNQGRAGSSYPMPLLLLRFDWGDTAVTVCRIACHPTVLDEKNTLLSRDIPGAAEKAADPNSSYLFYNGACGDVSTRFTRTASTPEELYRLGGILGTALRETEPTEDAQLCARIRTAEQRFFVRLRNGLEPEERLSLMQALREKMTQCTDAQANREYDSRLAVLERKPVLDAPKEKEICVSVVDLGSLLFVSLPFETDSADGEALEAVLSRKAGKPVYLIGYTNGYEGYLPSGAPLTPDSSYEDFASKYVPEVRTQILDAAAACIEQTKQ